MEKTILDNIILVQSNLFTPLTRTPWAGSKIIENYKNKLHPDALGTKVGESWEFSCDPKFCSTLKGEDFTFNELFKKYPEQALSAEQVKKWGESSHILIKLLNADAPLSVSIVASCNRINQRQAHLAFHTCFMRWFEHRQEDRAHF